MYRYRLVISTRNTNWAREIFWPLRYDIIIPCVGGGSQKMYILRSREMHVFCDSPPTQGMMTSYWRGQKNSRTKFVFRVEITSLYRYVYRGSSTKQKSKKFENSKTTRNAYLLRFTTDAGDDDVASKRSNWILYNILKKHISLHKRTFTLVEKSFKKCGFFKTTFTSREVVKKHVLFHNTIERLTLSKRSAH